MNHLNYKRLVELTPTIYATFTNSLDQVIELVEHPLYGDEYPVIAIYHDEMLAVSTDFYDIEDMLADHKEYEPIFLNGDLHFGYEL